jgi:hypothetical protein
LRVEAVRVVDLVKESEEGGSPAGFMTDIRDLPDVVAIKARGEDDDANCVANMRERSDGWEFDLWLRVS